MTRSEAREKVISLIEKSFLERDDSNFEEQFGRMWITLGEHQFIFQLVPRP